MERYSSSAVAIPVTSKPASNNSGSRTPSRSSSLSSTTATRVARSDGACIASIFPMPDPVTESKRASAYTHRGGVCRVGPMRRNPHDSSGFSHWREVSPQVRKLHAACVHSRFPATRVPARRAPRPIRKGTNRRERDFRRPNASGHEQGDNQVLGKLHATTVAMRRLLAGTMLSLALASVPLAPAAAQDSLTNTVTVTPSPAVVDGTPGNNTDSAVVQLRTAVDYDFCPAGGENFVLDVAARIWRYDGIPDGEPERVDELSDFLQPDTTSEALMLDPVRNRLLYVQPDS